MHTLKDIKGRGGSKEVRHRLGSAYEEKLEKKLYSALRSKAEINDLSEELLAKISEYSEQEEKFHQINAVVKNKISQIDAVNTRLRSQITSKRMSRNGLEVEHSAKIKSLKSLIKSLKKEVTLAQKASFSDKITIYSLEAKIVKLESKLLNSIPQPSFFDFNNTIEEATEIINEQEKPKLPNWVNANLKVLSISLDWRIKHRKLIKNKDIVF